MNNPEEEFILQLRPRPQETVSLEIPKDTLESLRKIADSRDMSCEALLKFYIGQGLRQDVAKLFSNRVLEATAQVLARHIQSEAEISDILQEIRSQTNS
jgi:transcriptional regulator of met regulon